MAAELDGMRIATLEARMTGALASLISKRGGEPLSAPALREAPLDCAEDVRYLLDKLESEELDVVVFQTGVGARALFKEADRQGGLPFLLSALRGVTTVCRGPKPTAALKQVDVQISHRYCGAIYDEGAAGGSDGAAGAGQEADGAAVR